MNWRVLVLALAALAPAAGACTRPFVIPVAPIGLSVTIQGNAIGGIYPEVLRSIGEKSGCQFQLTSVPRARQEAMFEAGKADLLMPASRTPRRDQHGYFVPLVGSRALLLSLGPEASTITTVAQLLARRELRVAVVRGFDYGEPYQALLDELKKQGRLYFEADPVGVARLLKAKYADLTIMAPIILFGATQGDQRVTDIADKIRGGALAELEWGQSGIYISKHSVTPEDRATLEQLLSEAVKSGTVWEAFKRRYPVNILSDSVRQR
ncbi:MAG: transporter substrate-binding domain-containing protein [Pseudomonadota bacterium]